MAGWQGWQNVTMGMPAVWAVRAGGRLGWVMGGWAQVAVRPTVGRAAPVWAAMGGGMWVAAGMPGSGFPAALQEHWGAARARLGNGPEACPGAWGARRQATVKAAVLPMGVCEGGE